MKESLVEHLARRQPSPSLYAGLVIDEPSRTVTFPLWNLMGQMVGFQQYRPDVSSKESVNPSEDRYFTICSKGEKATAITAFGIDLCSLQRSKICFIAEGVSTLVRYTFAL